MRGPATVLLCTWALALPAQHAPFDERQLHREFNEAQGDTGKYARAEVLATYYGFYGKAECVQWVDTSLRYARLLHDSARVMQTLGYARGYYTRTGLYADAIAVTEQMIARSDVAKDAGKLVGLHCHAGYCLSALGERAQALKRYEEAIALVGRYKLDPDFMAQPLYSIGRLYFETGDPKNAETYLLQCLPLTQKKDDRVGQAQTWMYLGMARS
ncbi:MAG TPA: tetratricopeptide repeat protein, partial [Flavobacteriales bacterium]|nr:tetratricopeptide repeat protein [Flavobacteriales bacterium]